MIMIYGVNLLMKSGLGQWHEALEVYNYYLHLVAV